MDPTCQRCGRKIPKRRLENARRTGVQPKYDSDRCQNAAKQERHRKQIPVTRQDKIHLRNLVAHGMIAEKMLRDPTIVAIARDNLTRWFEQNGVTPALLEWQLLLERGDMNALLIALLRVDDEGMRLRSSSPFTNILSDFERELVFEAARK